MKFDCSRYCRKLGRDECRFLAVLPVREIVTSHTTCVEVEIRSKEAFAASAQRIGGTVIGEGTHALFSSQEAGFAVRLPGWHYPIVLTDKGLKMDHYNGHWGNPKDIDRLVGYYAIEAAREKAFALGWVSQDQGENLVIYHPEGGTITVSPDGTCASAGFVGCGCDEAKTIEEALGREVIRENTHEYFAEKARISEAGE